MEEFIKNEPCKTPNLDEMLKHRGESELCKKFLDWFLQKYTAFEKRQRRETALVNPCGSGDYIDKERLLAEFFGIDLDEAEKERELLLNGMRGNKQ